MSGRSDMPTSIGHAVGGYVVADVVGHSSEHRLSWLAIGFVALFVANLPDLDFVPGILVGHSERFHRGPSHSVAAGFGAVLLLTPLACRLFGGRLLSWALVIGAAYGSHLVLDLLMRDPTGGPGIALLWPLTERRFAWIAPGQQMLDPFRTLNQEHFRSDFLGALLRPATVKVFLIDGLLVAPLVLLGRAWSRWSRWRWSNQGSEAGGAH